MPRTTEEILAHADELARRFEEHEPGPDEIRDAATLRELARAFEQRARADADLASAVATARADGHTWAAIGAMLGTSGEAARQRYGVAPPGTAGAPRGRRAEAAARLRDRADQVRQTRAGERTCASCAAGRPHVHEGRDPERKRA